jgi:signal peptidase II
LRGLPAVGYGSRPMKLILALTLPLYALDQLTKWLVVSRFGIGDELVVVPGFFSLTYLTNTGAAFSMFHDSNLFFIALSTVALVVLAVCALRGMVAQKLTRIALALLAAGILGNLTDRIFHKHVVDFLLFDLHVRFANPWPAFNVADSCICTAAGLIFLQSFLEARAEKRGAGPDAGA